MAARASFQHEALSSTKAIRVLTVLPSRTLESEIICELCEVQLGNVQDLDKRSNGRPLFSSRSSTSYEALSYVWGSSECDRRIVCNGEYMTITSSCYYALVYLRKTRKRRRLWIDAICINQEWTQERNSQILLMGDIYRHATRVVIWLGVGVNGTRDFLRRLAWNAAYRRFEDESWLGKEVIGPLRNKWMPNFGSAKISDLYVFTDIEWFERIWTMQELLFATDVVIMCGNGSVVWRSLMPTHWNNPANFEQIAHFELLSDAWSMKAIFDIYKGWQSSATPLLDASMPNRSTLSSTSQGKPGIASMHNLADRLLFGLCRIARAKTTSEPHDRVYGLHSTLKAMSLDIRDPNYDLPLNMVYRNFIAAIIHRTRSLVPLTDLGSDLNSLEGPSWAVNLASGLGSDHEMFLLNAGSVIPRFRQGFSPVIHATELSIGGICLAEIQIIADLDDMLEDELESDCLAIGVEYLFRLYIAALRLKTAVELVQQGFPAMPRSRVFEMLVWELSHLYADKWPTIVVESFRRAIARVVKQFPALISHIKNLGPDINLAELKREWDMVWGSDMDVVLLKAMQQRLFRYGWIYLVVSSNGYAGWVRLKPQIGDAIYLCFGASRSLILRSESSSTHRVISVCTIGGMPKDLWPLDSERQYDAVKLITLI